MRRILNKSLLALIVLPLFVFALASCGGGGGGGGGVGFSLRRGGEEGDIGEGELAPSPDRPSGEGPGMMPTAPGRGVAPGPGEMPGMMGMGRMPGAGGAQQRQPEREKKKESGPPLYKPAKDPFLPPTAPKVAPVEGGRRQVRPVRPRPPIPQPLTIPPVAVSPPTYAPTGLSLARPTQAPRREAAPRVAPAGPPLGAQVSGVASNDRVMAIIEVGGRSIVVKPGDPIDPVIEGAYIERIEPTGVVVRRGEETFTIPVRGR